MCQLAALEENAWRAAEEAVGFEASCYEKEALCFVTENKTWSAVSSARMEGQPQKTELQQKKIARREGSCLCPPTKLWLVDYQRKQKSKRFAQPPTWLCQRTSRFYLLAEGWLWRAEQIHTFKAVLHFIPKGTSAKVICSKVHAALLRENVKKTFDQVSALS